MIEPKNSFKCEVTGSRSACASVNFSLATENKNVTTTPLSVVSEETMHDCIYGSPLTTSKATSHSPEHQDYSNEIDSKKHFSENSKVQNIKDLLHNARDSCSNFIKNGSANFVKNQSVTSRGFSNSVDDCVEIQEYLQEEEIGDDNTSKGIFSNACEGRIACKSSNDSSQELQHGFRILSEILSDSNKNLNWPFLNPVDSTQDGCQDYYERIKSPMWLLKMKEKFVKKGYGDVTEFVRDMRLMIDNCLLFNGPDHSISKKAKKLETVLNQKVTLLSRDLRDKINEAVPPRNHLVATDTLEQLQPKPVKHGKDSRRRMRELQKQRMMERKLMHDHFVNTLQVWDENLFDEVTRPQMRAMWELPQLGLFFFLCSRPLNLNISQYELERCFILSRQSSAMQKLMSSLFSSANQRSKLHLGNLLPTKVWEEKLKDHISSWFKSLVDSNYDVVKVSEKLAIEEQFFKIMGFNNPLITKSYHDLTYYQKVWIVKSFCDHLLNNQKSLLDAIEKQDMIDLRPRELGNDSGGNTYFYFSQFCGDDVRIYRQSPLPTVEIGPIEFTFEDECYYSKKRTKSQSKKRPRKVMVIEELDDFQTPRTRDSRLRQNPRQLKNYRVESNSTSSESESDSEEEREFDDGSSQEKSSGTDKAPSENNIKSARRKVNNSRSSKSTKTVAVMNKSNNLGSEQIDGSGNDWTLASSTIPRRSERKIIEESIKNAEHKTKSNGLESTEKLNKKRNNRNDWAALVQFLPERNLRSRKQNSIESVKVEEPSVKTFKKDIKRRSGKNHKDMEVDSENDESIIKSQDVSSMPSEAQSVDSSDMTDIKNEDPSDTEDNDSLKGSKEHHSTAEDEFDQTQHGEKMEVDEEHLINFEPTLLGPNMEEFELVAENIQDIRDLINKIGKREENEGNLNVSCQSKNTKRNPEKFLLENLGNLLKDLEPHESKLIQALKKARMQMRKEEESYKDVPDIPDEEPAGCSEVSTKETPSPSDYLGEDVGSGEPKDIESINPPLENSQEVKKKNIFENDIDIALLLTEGRVLRKRNNVQAASQCISAITRSKRLLNKPSRYKYDDFLTDEAIMASACNDNISEHRVHEETPTIADSSTSLVLPSLLSDALKHQSVENTLNVNINSNQIASAGMTSLPCISTITDSAANLAKVSIVYSTGLKSPTARSCNALTPPNNHKSPIFNSTPQLYQAKKIVDQIIQAPNAFLPLKMATLPPTPPSKATPSPVHEFSSKNSSSGMPNLQNQKSIAQINAVQVGFNSTKVLSPPSGLSILSLASNNNISPSLILLPKNFSLNHTAFQGSNAISQHFMAPIPVGIPSSATPAITNKPIQICPVTSSMVLNFQNLLPISNTNMNNQAARVQSSSLVALNAGSPAAKTTKPMNITSMSLASRVVIPLKAQVPGNLSSPSSAQSGQLLSKVGGLIPILSSASSLPNMASNMQANINRLPVQVGPLNCENGQSIFLLANNSFTQIPPPQKSVTPVQIPPMADSNSPNKDRPCTNSLENQSLKPNITNEAIVQQLVLSNLSNSSMAHQLVSPGLIQVSTARTNSNAHIRCPTPVGITISNKNLVNVPILLNKDVFRVLSQPQTPLQLSQVTSQGK